MNRLLNTAHKLRNWALFWILLLLCSYEGLIQYFQPKGFNAFKLIVAGFMFMAFCLLIYLVRQCSRYKSTFPPAFRLYYVAYVAYCIITILRSAKPDVQVIANLIGNYTTGMGLLVPLVVVAGDRIINLDILRRTGLKFIWIGILLAPLGFIQGRLALFSSPFIQFSYLLLPFWQYFSRREKQLVIAGLFACLLVSLLTNVRAIMMREFLIIGCFVAYYTLRQKSVTAVAFLIVFIGAMGTLALYGDELTNLFNQREINFIGIKIDNDQNRAWMYEEVYSDLAKHNDLTFGRGALGRYFSDFFYSVYEYEGESADDYNRYNIEVGFLSYLLKGGYVLLWASLSLLLAAGFTGLVKSGNVFTRGAGIVILCHTVGMAIENYPKLAAYDVVLWLYAGACLSLTIRKSKNPFWVAEPPVRRSRPEPVQVASVY